MENVAKRFTSAAIAVAMALGLVLGLTSCGSANNDEEQIRTAIASTFDAFKNPTEESVGKYLEGSGKSTLEQLDALGVDFYELIGHLFKQFQYSIGDINVDGDAATAEMTFTNVDVQKAVNDATVSLQEDKKLAAEVSKLMTAGDEESVKKGYKIVFDKMYEALDSSEDMVTNDMTMRLHRTDDGWDIDDDNVAEMVSKVYGGLDMSTMG